MPSKMNIDKKEISNPRKWSHMAEKAYVLGAMQVVESS
uniref:Uncharacterized protein n=1 Tax=Rhizophora mucronata TaxID=61149 RepID=A0A2P2PKL0_RHIMU